MRSRVGSVVPTRTPQRSCCHLFMVVLPSPPHAWMIELALRLARMRCECARKPRLRPVIQPPFHPSVLSAVSHTKQRRKQQSRHEQSAIHLHLAFDMTARSRSPKEVAAGDGEGSRQTERWMHRAAATVRCRALAATTPTCASTTRLFGPLNWHARITLIHTHATTI